MKTLVFTSRVVGEPKAQPRARAVSIRGAVRMYNPATATDWKNNIKGQCLAIKGLEIEQAISLELDFYLPRPKSHYLKSGRLCGKAPAGWHQQKPDADNLAKSVMDAISELRAWGDDDQVVELTVRKFWEIVGGRGPGLAIRLSIYP